MKIISCCCLCRLPGGRAGAGLVADHGRWLPLRQQQGAEPGRGRLPKQHHRGRDHLHLQQQRRCQRRGHLPEPSAGCGYCWQSDEALKLVPRCTMECSRLSKSTCQTGNGSPVLSRLTGGGACAQATSCAQPSTATLPASRGRALRHGSTGNILNSTFTGNKASQARTLPSLPDFLHGAKPRQLPQVSSHHLYIVFVKVDTLYCVGQWCHLLSCRLAGRCSRMTARPACPSLSSPATALARVRAAACTATPARASPSTAASSTTPAARSACRSIKAHGSACSG